MIIKQLQSLRKRMKEEGIDAYLILSDDFHGSEYVGEYFKCREFISGFTGSTGTVLITQNMAGLWTDGRYFLQAESQLKGSTITLFRIGEEGVPSIKEFLADELQENQCLGFDGRTVSDAYVQELKEQLLHKKIRISGGRDLVGEIWSDRSPISKEPIIILETQYAGCTMEEKVEKIRCTMRQKDVDFFILTSLDDIAWLFNMRGNDIKYSPLFLAYAIISPKEIYLFAHQECFRDEVKATLQDGAIRLMEYEEIYEFVRKIKRDSTVLLDKRRTNYAIVQNISEGVRVTDERNLTLLLKAVKNDKEVENERMAHIWDGVAVTKFLFWLKKNLGQITITEISGAQKLEEFRKEQKHYIGPSFAPIFAYESHGAIVHYSATRESDATLQKRGLLLLDTGGHYLEGSTDITRTIALGPISDCQKSHYTAVMRGNLNLGAAKFLYGCRGVNLDYLARQPLWEMGLNYNHGTGHGVGYLLNVHEGPNNIGWRMAENVEDHAILEEGMITSNEPGIYVVDEYGIRLENLMLCQKAERTKYGQFMRFETLTMVPFDRDSINREDMSERERQLLNAYHKMVYDTITPYLNDEEQAWLLEATEKI